MKWLQRNELPVCIRFPGFDPPVEKWLNGRVKKRGLFISVEGGDGAGKSTQARLLAGWLRRGGMDVVHTREPGGTSIAEAVRRVLLRPGGRVSPMTELFLYEAARAQHVAEIIAPALKAGKTVLCERYTDATEAYQGWGRCLPLDQIRTLNRIATGGLQPDLTLLLEAPVADGLRRARSRGKGGDRLEREPDLFHRRVRVGYRAIAKREPRRVKIVSWATGVEKVHEKVLLVVERFLTGCGFKIRETARASFDRLRMSGFVEARTSVKRTGSPFDKLRVSGIRRGS